MDATKAVRVSSCYLPARELLAALSDAGCCHVDIDEPWQKQTLRNRTYILGPNGVQTLTVPVCHTGRITAPIREIRISYAEPWLRVHKGALFSAYNSSPFFEYFRDELFSIFDSKPAYLIDLNESLHEFLRRRLRTEYRMIGKNEAVDYLDRRPLARREVMMATLKPGATYPQVFEYKFPFTPFLSAIDVLSAQGHL